jgi:hypothetical protein
VKLVPFQGAIRVELVLEDSFVDDYAGTNRTRDKIPGGVGDQSIIFFLHGTTPRRVSKGVMDEGGH